MPERRSRCIKKNGNGVPVRLEPWHRLVTRDKIWQLLVQLMQIHSISHQFARDVLYMIADTNDTGLLIS